MGFVRLVTALVKPVKSPTTPAETAVAPLMILAAKSEPGKWGSVIEGFEELPEAALEGAELPTLLTPPPTLAEGAA